MKKTPYGNVLYEAESNTFRIRNDLGFQRKLLVTATSTLISDMFNGVILPIEEE